MYFFVGIARTEFQIDSNVSYHSNVTVKNKNWSWSNTTMPFRKESEQLLCSVSLIWKHFLFPPEFHREDKVDETNEMFDLRLNLIYQRRNPWRERSI